MGIPLCYSQRDVTLQTERGSCRESTTPRGRFRGAAGVGPVCPPLLPASLPANSRAMATVHRNAPFPGGTVRVESNDIASLTLVTPLPLWARIYVLPWLALYPLAYYAFYIEYDRYIQSIGPSSFALQTCGNGRGLADADCCWRWRWRQNGPSCSASASLEAMLSASCSPGGASASGLEARRGTYVAYSFPFPFVSTSGRRS